jgi:hypothetical protein
MVGRIPLTVAGACAGGPALDGRRHAARRDRLLSMLRCMCLAWMNR